MTVHCSRLSTIGTGNPRKAPHCSPDWMPTGNPTCSCCCSLSEKSTQNPILEINKQTISYSCNVQGKLILAKNQHFIYEYFIGTLWKRGGGELPNKNKIISRMCERRKNILCKLSTGMKRMCCWLPKLSWVVHSLSFALLLVFDIWQYVRRIRFAFGWWSSRKKKLKGNFIKRNERARDGAERRTWWWRRDENRHWNEGENREKIVYDLIWVSFCVLCVRVLCCHQVVCSTANRKKIIRLCQLSQQPTTANSSLHHMLQSEK